MRKTYLLLLLLITSVQLFAQRHVDFETVMATPVNGDLIVRNQSFTLKYYWINHGPDTIVAGDTALAQFYIDTVMMSQGQYLFSVTVRPGDSITIQVPFTLDIPDSLAGMGSFCVNSTMQGMGAAIIDTHQSNNKSCAESITFMSHGLSLSPVPAGRPLQVCPVPASDYLTFALPSGDHGLARIKVHDFMGRSLMEVAQAYNPAGNSLNVAALQPGNYIYTVCVYGNMYKGIFTVSR